jgi:hypothetical protein
MSCQLLVGGAQREFRLCSDKIHDGLGLGQIHFPIQKRPLSEFPWICHSSPGRQEQIQHPPSHQNSTMATDLHHILSGITVRSLKISHQNLVNFPGSIVDFPESHLARNKFLGRDCTVKYWSEYG